MSPGKKFYFVMNGNTTVATLELMNTPDTCALCERKDLQAILSAFNIDILPHDPMACCSYNSFIKTFSVLFETTEDLIKETIANHKIRQQFIDLLKWEFGRNLEFAFENDHEVANVAWICALAEQYQREIIVFCDFYCLNFCHNGKKIIVFKPSDHQRNGSPIGCALFGMNIFHPLSDSELYADIASNTSYRSINYISLTTEQELGNERVLVDERDSRDVQFVERNPESPDVPIPVTGLGSPSEEPFLAQNIVNQHLNPNELVTLEEFLNLHFRNDSPQNISMNAYTSNCKLNLKDSSITSDSLNIQKTHDIDGFFAVFNIEDFGKILKNTSVTFQVHPSLIDSRTKKNINKFTPSLQNQYQYGIKLGFLSSAIKNIDIIIIINTTCNFTDQSLSQIALESSNYARTLPCREIAAHIRQCQSGTVRNNHRTTMRADPDSHNKQEVETYTPVLASCYMFHFNNFLTSKLARMQHTGDIKVFFKCIGSKSSTFSDNLEECFNHIKSFEKAINFKKLNMNNVWIDYSITASAETFLGPVNHLEILFYSLVFFKFLGCFILER